MKFRHRLCQISPIFLIGFLAYAPAQQLNWQSSVVSFEYADFLQIFGQRSCFLGPRKNFIQKIKYSLIKAGQAVLRVCFHYMENVLDLSKMLWILMMLVKRIVISNLDLNIITDWQILKIPRYLQKIFTLKLHHHGTICRLRK